MVESPHIVRWLVDVGKAKITNHLIQTALMESLCTVSYFIEVLLESGAPAHAGDPVLARKRPYFIFDFYKRGWLIKEVQKLEMVRSVSVLVPAIPTDVAKIVGKYASPLDWQEVHRMLFSEMLL